MCTSTPTTLGISSRIAYLTFAAISCAASREIAASAVTADQRDADSNERRQRADRIGAVMPGIGGDDSAAYFLSHSRHSPVKDLLDDDHASCDEEREWRGQVMRRHDLANRQDRDSDR